MGLAVWRIFTFSADTSDGSDAKVSRPRLRGVDPPSTRTQEGDRDLALLHQLRAGDTEAFETLYHTYAEPLCTFAVRYAHTRAAAQDAVQDAFVGFWVRRASLQVHTTVRAYLYWLVRNRALDNARRTHECVEETALGIEQISLTLPDSTDIVQEFEAEELTHRLAAACDALPDRQRDALRLWWHEAMTYTEIGHVLGVSDVAARKLVGKAIAKLRPLIDP